MNRFLVLLPFLLVLHAGAAEPVSRQAVSLAEKEAEYVLSNGDVTARINRNSGEFTLAYQGQTVITRGYWSQVGRAAGGDIGRFGGKRSSRISVDPAGNEGERAEVSCQFSPDDRGGLPCDVEMRYALGRGDQGLYVYAVWEHKPGYPGFSVGEARHALKLPAAFDYLAIDTNRHGVLPSGADWDRGEQLNMKEVRRIKTGPFAGRVEHKYDYSAILAEVPAYGWASTTKRLGIWLINPSNEYIAGGPTKVELTGHLDVNPGGAPVLLNMWHGSHYGGSSLVVREQESWRKVVGPFFYYCNSGKDPEGLHQDALTKAREQQAQWPYPWARHEEYTSRPERARVNGRIVVNDPGAQGLAVRNLQVGLAAAPHESAETRGRGELVDWQRDNKHYQFWTRADAHGKFSIPNVRPGTYTVYAFADGVLGEFSEANVTVRSGASMDLGTLTWKPVRYGRQVWEIGIPNRSAEEFRHGDHYWRWGLYYDYAKEFPNDVRFVIGKSDWRKDWNYCQPPRIQGNKTESTTWTIEFDLKDVPRSKATLRLAIAGSRVPSGVEIMVNGKAAGGTGRLPDTGVMHRDGIRGYWCERKVEFDAALLKQGVNTIQFHVPSRNWTQGLLYDYLRLEAE